MVFPVVMCGCESWTRKKAERQRIDAFKLWCWRRVLRVPWTARKSNQSIPKEINLEYSLEGLMLKLKLQYFGHLMRRADSLKKTLMLGKMEGRRRRGQQRMRWFDGITDNGHEFEEALGVGDREGSLACSPWDCKESDVAGRLELNSDTIDMYQFSSVQFSHSVMSDFCNPMDCSTPGLPVHCQLLELPQIHVH